MLAHLAAQFLAAHHDLLDHAALRRQLGGRQHDQSLTQGGAAGIQHPDLPLRILLRQLTGHQPHAPAGAADAAGQPHIQHILTVDEIRLHALPGGVGRDHGGLHRRATPQGLVKLAAIELLRGVRRHAVHRIGQAKLLNTVLLPQCLGQICRVVCDDMYHKCLLLLPLARAALTAEA